MYPDLSVVFNGTKPLNFYLEALLFPPFNKIQINYNCFQLPWTSLTVCIVILILNNNFSLRSTVQMQIVI